MSILSTDKLLVCRSAQSYYVDQKDIADKEEAGDLLLINRSGESFKVDIEEVHDKVLDSDIALANRGGVSFRATGAELKAAIPPPGIESLITNVSQDPLLDYINGGVDEFTGDSWGPFNGNWGEQNSSFGIDNQNSYPESVTWIFKRPILLKRYFTFGGKSLSSTTGELAHIITDKGTQMFGRAGVPSVGRSIDLNQYFDPPFYLLQLTLSISAGRWFRFENFGHSNNAIWMNSYNPTQPSTFPSADETIVILPTDRQTVVSTADNLVIPNSASISQSDGNATGVTVDYKNGYSSKQIPLQSSTGSWVANGTNKVVYQTRRIKRLLDVAVAIDGYYPLFTLEEEANIIGNGTSHAHVFDGVTYYMPDGGVETYHGNYNSPAAEDTE